MGCSHCGLLGHLDRVCGHGGKLAFIWKQCIKEPNYVKPHKQTATKQIWVPKRSVYTDIEEATDNFVRGIPSANLQFVRAGGTDITVLTSDGFLD